MHQAPKLIKTVPKYVSSVPNRLAAEGQIYTIGEYLRNRELMATDRVASKFSYGPMVDPETNHTRHDSNEKW